KNCSPVHAPCFCDSFIFFHVSNPYSRKRLSKYVPLQVKFHCCMNTPQTEALITEQLDTHFGQFEKDLKKVLAENCHIKTIPAGEQLVQPRQYFKSPLLITGGLVKLYREGNDGGEFFIYPLKPGEACALSMICATKQEKSEILATAVEDTTALLIPITMMDDLMRTY